MDTKEAYKHKAEAELELAQAKLAEFKAKAKGLHADAQIKFTKQVEELEGHVTATKTKLKELAEKSDDAWEHLKGGVENGLKALRSSIQKTLATLKP